MESSKSSREVARPPRGFLLAFSVSFLVRLTVFFFGKKIKVKLVYLWSRIFLKFLFYFIAKAARIGEGEEEGGKEEGFGHTFLDYFILFYFILQKKKKKDFDFLDSKTDGPFVTPPPPPFLFPYANANPPPLLV